LGDRNFGFAFLAGSPMFGANERRMGKLRNIFSKARPVTEEFPMPFYGVWDEVMRFSAHIRKSEFMREMVRRRDAQGSHGLMGEVDCGILYGLARWRRPSIVVESGGYLGMSSAFILKALADEGLTSGKIFSIEWNKDCPHGVLIPKELRGQFVPLTGDVRDLIKSKAIPPAIDMFLHDSSHRLAHMLWEFREFWKRLRDGGLLVSHDVHFNAAFPQFMARNYAHDKRGLLDPDGTGHYEWGRWGYVGFAIKKDS
jgi:predicted O-methyltransferase YrrM